MEDLKSSKILINKNDEKHECLGCEFLYEVDNQF